MFTFKEVVVDSVHFIWIIGCDLSNGVVNMSILGHKEGILILLKYWWWVIDVDQLDLQLQQNQTKVNDQVKIL